MFFSSCGGKWVSSRMATGNLGFLLSCNGKLGFSLELQLGCQTSSRVVLWQLISSRDVQGGSCLVAMLGGCSRILAWDFSILVLGVNSVVVVGLILSSDGVQTPLYLWCEIRLLEAEGLLSMCDV